VDRRVATAAVELYGEVGWAGFNIDAVARRAGVGKTSVYLRWSNRLDLLVDALRTRVADVAQVDSGDVRTDLVLLARQFLDLYLGDAGAAAMRLGVEAERIDALDARREALSGSQDRAALAIVERAVARGELPAGTSAQLLIDAVSGAALFHVMKTLPRDRERARQDSGAYAEQLVDLLLDGFRMQRPSTRTTRSEVTP